MGFKEKNIIDDTLKLCKTNQSLKGSIKNSKLGQKVYTTTPNIEHSSCNSEVDVVISKKRSFEAAKKYRKSKVGVLNFASFTNPGGGVLNGSIAQEECLCRCSTLFPCLDKLRGSYYDRHRFLLETNKLDYFYNDDCIYTPDVVVFKQDTENASLERENFWYTVDVISCAAPNLRRLADNKRAVLDDNKLLELYTNRIRRIFAIAKENGVDVLILGAFGCGVFRNDPLLIAKAFKVICEEFKYDFKTIEFAIYCSKKDVSNYSIFKEVFN